MKQEAFSFKPAGKARQLSLCAKHAMAGAEEEQGVLVERLPYSSCGPRLPDLLCKPGVAARLRVGDKAQSLKNPRLKRASRDAEGEC